jgi:hypothetical protein
VDPEAIGTETNPVTNSLREFSNEPQAIIAKSVAGVSIRALRNNLFNRATSRPAAPAYGVKTHG